MTSTGSRPGHLPSRGSYSQPVAPTVAGMNAQGRMSQPQPKTNAKGYNISAPVMQEQEEIGQPSAQVPSKFARVAGVEQQQQPTATETKGHKRSSTIGGFFSRSNSIFGGKSSRKESNADQQEKPKKSYPPVSMQAAFGQGTGYDTPRQSMDSRRSISFGFGKKRSGSITGGSQTTLQDKPRRFSFLPSAVSLKAIGIGKDPPSEQYERPDSRVEYNEPPLTTGSRNISSTINYPATADGNYDRVRDSPMQERRGTSTGSPSHQHYVSHGQAQDPRSGAPPQFLPPMNFRQGESILTTESESSLGAADFQNRRGVQPYPPGFNESDTLRKSANSRGNGRGVLQKSNRKFAEAYEPEAGNGYGPTHTDHAGSSGAARKVMDFFRRRGRDRGEVR